MSDRFNDRADRAWADLRDRHDGRASADPSRGVTAHRPSAAILACSDARVPPSIVFEQDAGSLFVVRLAGNSATPAAIASLTYATAALETPLIVVLGHTGCGAVTAAVQGDPLADSLRAILAPIDEMLAECHDCSDIDAAVVANVRYNMRRLAADDGPLGAAISDGTVTVRGAVHDLRTGDLIVVDADPALTGPSPDNHHVDHHDDHHPIRRIS